MRLRVMDEFQQGMAHVEMFLEALLVKTILFILCGHEGSRVSSWGLNIIFTSPIYASFREWAPHFKGWVPSLKDMLVVKRDLYWF